MGAPCLQFRLANREYSMRRKMENLALRWGLLTASFGHQLHMQTHLKTVTLFLLAKYP